MVRHYYNKVLRERDRHVLKRLPNLSESDFYLAGGTGLAIQIGHRFSYDMDFFCVEPFRNDVIKQWISEGGQIQILQDAAGTVEAIVDETRVTFLHYAYPMLDNLVTVEGIDIASMLDIGLMKLSAVSSRGSRKDFIDLYCMRDKFPIRILFEKFDNKYKGSGYNLYHMIKSLEYFDDAEKEPMPNMIFSIHWDDVKMYFEQEGQTMAKAWL